MVASVPEPIPDHAATVGQNAWRHSYIVGNEAAERFSFYGMRAILFLFLTEHLLDRSGNLAPLDDVTATIWQHRFVSAVYFFPILGAIFSDWLFGKYRTILVVSVLYCAGHTAMAMVDMPQRTGINPQWMLILALSLLAVGAGGIKPCVSAHVGDQFGPENQHLLPRVFSWFYFAINVGAAASMIATPRLMDAYGPSVAFAVPGILMGLATLLFWLGRYQFVHVPASGRRFFTETFSSAGRRAIANLLPLYLFVAMFWCLFDQTQSRWVQQAKLMNRNVLGFEINPAEMQATNSILVLLLIPLFNYALYPLLSKFFELTPLRKIGIGLFVTIPSFAVPAWVQMRIDAGQTPHISWQLLAYVFITMAEVMVSITSLEFSYTQAPRKMKSFIMGLFMLSITLGNIITERVNHAIQVRQEQGAALLTGANYYWFFTVAMLVTACLFVVWSRFYRGQTYIQGDTGN